MEWIDFTTETGEQVSFYIVEQTMLAGKNYLLVTEDAQETGESEAYIMREREEQDGQIVYEMVEDDNELEAISRIFGALLEDIEIQM